MTAESSRGHETVGSTTVSAEITVYAQRTRCQYVSCVALVGGALKIYVSRAEKQMTAFNYLQANCLEMQRNWDHSGVFLFISNGDLQTGMC